MLHHTGHGQRYDTNMSDLFIQQLGLPQPDINLGVGSSSHARQMSQTMARFGPVAAEMQRRRHCTIAIPR